MEIVINGFFFGVGVIIGMYITTQISYWIEKQIKK
jgi:uncharacterized protein YneF (UPF0154 family)